MARDLNHVVLIGRLVRDPEIRYTANGTPVAKFSIANNNSYMQNNERKEAVSYFDINVWGNQAVNCEKYLKKGSQVAINGSLKQNIWVDQATNQKRSKVEITANSVQFLSSNASPQGGGGSYQQSNQSYGNQPANQPMNQQPARNQGNYGQSDNSGFIQDPWAETNNYDSQNAGGNGGQFNDPFMSSPDNDDDIPF